MFERTQQTIDDLTKADWFVSVGEHIDDGNIARVHSWDTAISAFIADSSIDAHGEARNEIMNVIVPKLNVHSPNSPRARNRVVDEIQKHVLPLVERKVNFLIQTRGVSDSFVNGVKWQMTAIATAVEYSDVFVSSFYMNIRDWYLKGHFPCGWEGTYPRGRMIVF